MSTLIVTPTSKLDEWYLELQPRENLLILRETKNGKYLYAYPFADDGKDFKAMLEASNIPFFAPEYQDNPDNIDDVGKIFVRKTHFQF